MAGKERAQGREAGLRWLVARLPDLTPWAMVVASTLASTALVASHFLVRRVNLRVGQVAPQNVYATREVVNRPLTQLLRQQAAQRVPPVYVFSPQAPARAQVEVGRIFRALARVRASRGGLSQIRRATGLSLSSSDAQVLLGISARTLAQVEADTRSVVAAAMSVGYRATPASLAAGRQQIQQAVTSLNLRQPALSHLVELAALKAFRPSFVYSPSETARARAQAMAKVPPAYVLPGDIVVVAGSRVTRAQVEILRELGLEQGQGNTWALVGACALTLTLLGLVAVHVRRRRHLGDDRTLAWVGSLAVVGTLAIGRLVASVSLYLVPVATASILGTVLVDAGLGTMLTLVTSILAAVALGADQASLASWLAAGLAATWSLVRIRDRRAPVRALFFSAGAAVITALAFVLLGDTQSGVGWAAWANLAFAAGGSLLAVVLSFGSLPFFESFLGILTSVRLLELSNPNQPLLRRLLMEAPGTYHHSVVVSNLAEAAAEAIGANGLLARVGAFYHDVGKLRRPFFFVDNQFGAPNPHDRLAPSLSALIILSHVKDGVAIGREYGLPPQILDFIAQHHGTTRVQFFWQKALEQAGGPDSPQAPREADFRYPGPKPHTREVAVVMLADTCEAAVRALPKPTPQRIEARVRALIRQRLDDGQLDEADLTLRDLDTVANVFTQVLSGVFHSRVAYPDNEQGLPAPPEGIALPPGAGGASAEAAPPPPGASSPPPGTGQVPAM